MNTKHALTTLLSLVCATALCAQTSRPRPATSTQPKRVERTPDPESAFAGPRLDERVYTHFGAGAHEGKAQSVNGVIGAAAANDGKPVRVAGTIQSVCQKKGCWIRVSDGGDEIFVKFKDYAFFLPKDAAGKQVVLEGTFKLKEQSVDEQKHYLEDAGKKEDAAKVVAPKREFTMLADGVAILGAPVQDGTSGKEGKAGKDGEPSPAPVPGAKK